MRLKRCTLLLKSFCVQEPRILWQKSPFQVFNRGNPTLDQLAYHYMEVKFKRINSSLTGKRLFVYSSKSLHPNRADPSLKLAMENPK
ncbi:hypothetical protein F2Q69_00020529 [Brassica cretica]|uniref:Uncharacterized protein n=1 Tax=Brassica cretica TaxID=69181 RepID=A0A8S9QHD3_BRACR|nr:hypothetical protein F2Q69_00020529 [Brassica cretica]